MPPVRLLSWLGSCVLAAATSAPVQRPAANDAGLPARVRRPVALAVGGEGRLLAVANRRAGTIAVVDLRQLRPVAETAVGRRLSDLAATAQGRRLLALDEDTGQLILLHWQGTELKVLHRIPVSAAPVSVRVNADGAWCAVASLWSRRLSVVDLPPADAKPRVARTVDLPFAPRLQVIVRDKVIVADSFGGALAVVDAPGGKLLSVRSAPGHNIRGLALGAGGKELLLAHQVLDPQAHTTRDDIHWGNLLTNKLRVLPLAGVLDPGADLLRGSRLDELGDVGHGAGDPAGVAVFPDGTVLVALAGTGEVALGTPARGEWTRLPVGRGPTAVVGADRGRAVVANTFGDSVTVVDMEGRKMEAEIRLGPPPVLNPAERGEMLFHDARLSHGGWFSCHSCHTDGHRNGLRADTLDDGSYGDPKRVLSLLGVRDTGPWAWNGSVSTLRDQIRKSLQTTMRGPEPAEEQMRDLDAYLRTLAPPPSLDHARGTTDEAAVRRGRGVFTARQCARCHEPPQYTTAKTHDVGLADEVGNRSFNPPSLCGVSQGGPYFHDSRAATLEEVLTRFRHGLQGELSGQELHDLLAFLRSL